ncbi:TlpA family protein disulfide reductase [Tenacibaculum finnmarkense]|uniref:TlpA family protein disulfide reductase n=1 Tax=Tenacibaculum finnmarkense TaxID=2781243 RepID=UPI001E3AD5F0|nr:TlpA disulfide reductase family protein [Tenacibaculum finnmarkense]MCD8443293.1 TlpA family protein disulfide reductase [Tenacibaculum finnmarkense genomovar ulcerans]
MKKIIYLMAIAITVISCKKEQNDFVTFSGKITNKNSDSIVLSNNQLKFKKVILVNKNGEFKDTLNIKDDFYQLFDGKEYTPLYLKNGATINMTLDTKQFDETVTYTGKGASESNFLAKSALLEEILFKNETLFELSKDDFNKKISNYITQFNTRINEAKLDSTFVTIQQEDILGLEKYVNKRFTDKLYLTTKLAKGMPSPKFVDYENNKEGKTSLEDLKGKYVYLDIWATWCNPCKKEIPALQKIEKQYHDKNIEFVSISIDNQKKHDAWKKMIIDKQLTGIQLFADNGWESKFIAGYVINSIPRFILIDPKGNIINADAPKPSSPKLIKLFKSLNL